MIFPYKYGIIALLLIAVSVGVTYKIHSIKKEADKAGYDRAVSEYTTKALEAEKIARKKEQELNEKVRVAEDEAAKRNEKIRDLTRDLNTKSRGLRDTIDSLKRDLSRDSEDAARRKAATALSVFDECQARYGEVAEDADRLSNELRKLIESWPQVDQK